RTVPRDSSAWASTYARLAPFQRPPWHVVYASPRGDYSISSLPGRLAVIGFVDARRDSVPGLYVRPDSSALDWEPVVLGDTLELAPGGKARARSIEIR